ncbi:MAG: DUF1844 domain-containing protein [Oligoflexia bacterium]|nr:DUF1844 domain-containing protein [Oligoflexia bacterium]
MDKRRFDSEGEERSAGKANETRPKASADNPSPSFESPTASDAESSGINFSSFVVSLATQTLMQLGQMKPPPGLDITPDREAARQTIDILAMLREKTNGNLDAQETKMFDEILHSLRMAYVKSGKGQ